MHREIRNETTNGWCGQRKTRLLLPAGQAHPQGETGPLEHRQGRVQEGIRPLQAAEEGREHRPARKATHPAAARPGQLQLDLVPAGNGRERQSADVRDRGRHRGQRILKRLRRLQRRIPQGLRTREFRLPAPRGRRRRNGRILRDTLSTKTHDL